ncbi:hypothetical protein BGZ63DRAFT_458545 [Mariannaea sp. PMI_226]|nr:hypothetical protein BGZ63DRAFT_458545 [Mariannaea sp. PMI_226]
MDESCALAVSFEWMALGRSLKEASTDSRKRFCLCLLVLGLSLLGQYDGDDANKILSLNEEDLLGIFMEIGSLEDLKGFEENEAHHCIALMRTLLKAVEDEEDMDMSGCGFDQHYSAQQNHTICGAVIDVYGTGSIDDVDEQRMREALSNSSVQNGQPVTITEIVNLLTVCKKVLEQDWVFL